MAKSYEQNLKMLAKDANLPLRYVPHFVGICQLPNWERPEDVTEVATPLCSMSCSYVDLCQLSNWERPEDVTEVATPLSCVSCSYVGLCQLAIGNTTRCH